MGYGEVKTILKLAMDSIMELSRRLSNYDAKAFKEHFPNTFRKGLKPRHKHNLDLGRIESLPKRICSYNKRRVNL